MEQDMAVDKPATMGAMIAKHLNQGRDHETVIRVRSDDILLHPVADVPADKRGSDVLQLHQLIGLL
jgi:hypothetical protein